MNATLRRGLISAVAFLLTGSLRGADIKVDLSREQVGRTPVTFEPMVGSWVVAEDGSEKVIMVDGRPWVASKDNPTRLLIASARRLYGTSNEELMDNAKQFAYYPVAVLKGVDNFSTGTISMKFKTVSGDSDRCSGILFNVKPNGDWLAIRYNDTENNIALWEFHNGIRRPVKFGPERQWMLDRKRVARVEDDDRGHRLEDVGRWGSCAGVHARKRAWSRPQRCAAPSRSDSREQPGAPPARVGSNRPLVEDRQHQLLQGLRGEYVEIAPGLASGLGRSETNTYTARFPAATTRRIAAGSNTHPPQTPPLAS
jgi:hypothetical protein